MPAFFRLPAGSMKMPASWWWKSALAGFIGGLALWLYMALVNIVVDGLNGFHFLNMVGTTYPGWNPLAVGWVAGPTLSGLFTHLGIATAIGLVYGMIVDLIPAVLTSLDMSIVLGAVAGFWTWVVVGRTIGPVVAPGFRAMTGNDELAWLIGNAIFGLVTAGALYLLAERKELAKVRVTMFPAERVPAGTLADVRRPI